MNQKHAKYNEEAKNSKKQSTKFLLTVIQVTFNIWRSGFIKSKSG